MVTMGRQVNVGILRLISRQARIRDAGKLRFLTSTQRNLMRFEPAFGDLIIRAKPRHFLPELAGMVQMPQMGQFMENDVVADKIGV